MILDKTDSITFEFDATINLWSLESFDLENFLLKATDTNYIFFSRSFISELSVVLFQLEIGKLSFIFTPDSVQMYLPRAGLKFKSKHKIRCNYSDKCILKCAILVFNIVMVQIDDSWTVVVHKIGLIITERQIVFYICTFKKGFFCQCTAIVLLKSKPHYLWLSLLLFPAYDRTCIVFF